jgi:hypothetical protein
MTPFRFSSCNASVPAARRAVEPVVVPPSLIAYGASPEVTSLCEDIAGELRIGLTTVKHLQTACAALSSHPRAVMIASAAIRPWDRAVVEEHAAGAGVEVLWVTSEHDLLAAESRIRAWALRELRRARTGR